MQCCLALIVLRTPSNAIVQQPFDSFQVTVKDSQVEGCPVSGVFASEDCLALQIFLFYGCYVTDSSGMEKEVMAVHGDYRVLSCR